MIRFGNFYSGYSYRFIIQILLFCFIHNKEYKTLGVVKLDQITSWSLVKGLSDYVGVTFLDKIYLIEDSNLALAFNSRNINDPNEV